jgi:hypothetical protein
MFIELRNDENDYCIYETRNATYLTTKSSARINSGEFAKNSDSEYIYEGSEVQKTVEEMGINFAKKYLQATGLNLKYEKMIEWEVLAKCEKAGITREEYDIARNSQKESMNFCVSDNITKREIGIKNIARFIDRLEFVRNKDLAWLLKASEAYSEIRELVDKINHKREWLKNNDKYSLYKETQYENRELYNNLTEAEKTQPEIRETMSALEKQGIVENRELSPYPAIPKISTSVK